MTKKTIELIEEKGYNMYKIEYGLKKNKYFFRPDILKGNHYEILVTHKEKNNEYDLIEIIIDGQGNKYKSYIIEDIRNTNTFKKLVRKLL